MNWTGFLELPDLYGFPKLKQCKSVTKVWRYLSKYADFHVIDNVGTSAVFWVKKYEKLIGVQSNHGVEYFGGPVTPTFRFPHN